MPKFVLFNTIASDGVGDFYHFKDIIKKILTDSRYSDVEFLAIVNFMKEGSQVNYNRIGEQLEALHIPFYYSHYPNDPKHYGLPHDDQIESNEELKEALSTADQAIIISNDGFGNAVSYRDYLKENIPLKTIYEHELRGWGWDWRSKFPTASQYLFSDDLGLQDAKSGIKIDDVPLIEPADAWRIIIQDDPVFSTKLLAYTESSNFETLHAHNVIVPAYFNDRDAFNSFVHFLGANPSTSQDKNIVMVVSGKGCELNHDALLPLLRASPVNKIELLTPNNEFPQVFVANPNGTKTIKIMQGFYLTDPSYNALFQLARESVAGVSGDNSFERCVSMNILPFYWSTNFRVKLYTLMELEKITQLPVLAISEEAKQSYAIYFDPRNYDTHSSHTKSEHQRVKPGTDPYLNINVQEMIAYWPVITAYLRKEKNFYNHFDDVILKGLPPDALPAFFKTQKDAQITREKLSKDKINTDPSMKLEKKTGDDSVQIQGPVVIETPKSILSIRKHIQQQMRAAISCLRAPFVTKPDPNLPSTKKTPGKD